MPFDSDSDFWSYLAARRPLDDADAYRRYIARIRDLPRFFDEQIANARSWLETRLLGSGGNTDRT